MHSKEKFERNTVILIPALDPPTALMDYVDQLTFNGFKRIVVVNDGSDEYGYGRIFQYLSGKEECIVLTHRENMGKGKSLKDGFQYFMAQYQKESHIKGIITVDSDGQHTVDDVIRLDNCFSSAIIRPELVLGVRNFKYGQVPFKSKFGNELTNKIFSLLYGMKLKDTQTGLRGIPKELVEEFVQLGGERFEYETNQLIYAVRKGIPVREIDIKTVYVDNNSETHFNPIKDSWKIYKILFASFLKYTISSVSASLIDLCVFQILLVLLKGAAVQNIWAATICARICSSLYNYFMNKNIVFESRSHHNKSFYRYYALCIVQMGCSAAGVSLIEYVIPAAPVLIKMVVDTVLFCISYRIQRKWVFAEGER